MYQKWPDQIFPIANLERFSNDGHFGLQGGGGSFFFILKTPCPSPNAHDISLAPQVYWVWHIGPCPWFGWMPSPTPPVLASAPWSSHSIQHLCLPPRPSAAVLHRGRFRTASINMLFIPGTPLKTTPLQKHARSIQNTIGGAESGPWDLWLPVVENNRLFAQRGHSTWCAP